MNHINYQITVNLFRIVNRKPVETQFAFEYSRETVNEMFSKVEVLLGEQLTQFDTITIRKSYK
jgi:hypothetical protein